MRFRGGRRKMGAFVRLRSLSVSGHSMMHSGSLMGKLFVDHAYRLRLIGAQALCAQVPVLQSAESGDVICDAW